MNNYTIIIKDENNPEAPVIQYTGIKSVEDIKAYIENMGKTSQEETASQESELPPCKPTHQAFYNYDKNPDISGCEPCQEQHFGYAKK